MITYKQIKGLKFKSEVCSDKVFEDIHGYPYTLFTKKLIKRVTVYWWQVDLKCEVMICDKKHNVIKRYIINDYKELKLLIDVFC